jgi:predicted short-subunit dehydrogenase-like oxidoreductase (DUF2520 family)
MHSIRNIAFAGSGNVAWHLAGGLKMKGFRISGIWSPHLKHAQKLAENCNSKAVQNVSDLKQDADLIILAVNDSAIGEVAGLTGNFDGIVAHTAGSVSIETLDIFSNYGVLYPLQTFSKEIPVDLSEVPFFTEASSAEVGGLLAEVALNLSDKVFEINSHRRMLLHVAAVFAGNFSNFMYSVSNELLKDTALPPELLNPLIIETARKAVTGNPLLMQTGPARRNDTLTLEKHIMALASYPGYAEIYRILSELISNKYNQKQ